MGPPSNMWSIADQNIDVWHVIILRKNKPLYTYTKEN